LADDQNAAIDPVFVSKVSGDQIIRTAAAADVHPSSGGAYQIHGWTRTPSGNPIRWGEHPVEFASEAIRLRQGAKWPVWNRNTTLLATSKLRLALVIRRTATISPISPRVPRLLSVTESAALPPLQKGGPIWLISTNSVFASGSFLRYCCRSFLPC